jgi:hypothetical protein
MGVAELHEAGALGVFDHAAFQRYGAKLVGLAAARSHECNLPAAVSDRGPLRQAFKFAGPASQDPRSTGLELAARDGQILSSKALIP